MGISVTLKFKITKRTCEEGEAFRPGYLLFKRIQSLLEMVEFHDGKQHGVCCSFITKWDDKNRDYYSEMSFDIDNRNFWFQRLAINFLYKKNEAKSGEDFWENATETKSVFELKGKSHAWEQEWIEFCKVFDCEVEVEEFVEQWSSSKMLISGKGVHGVECTEYIYEPTDDWDIVVLDYDGNIVKSDNAEDKDDESKTCSDDFDPPF